MVTFERRVGRLVEIRDDGGPAPPGMPKFGQVLALADEVGPGAMVVVCADMRRAKPLTAEQSEQVALAIRVSLTRVERGATLLPEQMIAGRQFERVYGESHRGFGPLARTPQEAIDALDPVLTAQERARLRAFLG
jgi:hypothetical protein